MLSSNLLKNVLKGTNRAFCRKNQFTSPILRESLRNSFSTGTEEASQDSTSLETGNQESAADSFFQKSQTGMSYGRLMGCGKHTLKMDIINFLEGCDLTNDDIKFEYNRVYFPVGVILQFPSLSAYNKAARLISRKGRLYRIERAQRDHWNGATSYDGKAVVIQGIPRTAALDEVERLLSGFSYDGSTIQLFTRMGPSEPLRLALVHFPNQVEAMNAIRMKNRGFCQNNHIILRLLQ